MVVLESLTSAERLSLVLHDVFGVSFEEIAPLVERSPAATRQLASRARRRVRAQAPEPDADLAVQRRAVDAFLAAAREGDFEALLQLLDPNAVLRTDGGPNAPRPLMRGPIVGAEAIASLAKNFRDVGVRFEPVIVNDAPGLLARFPARSLLWAFTVANGRIVEIDLIADPDKLRGSPLDCLRHHSCFGLTKACAASALSWVGELTDGSSQHRALRVSTGDRRGWSPVTCVALGRCG